MTAVQDSVRVHRLERVVTFFVEGCARMPHSVPLRSFAEQALGAGATSLRIDLHRCTHMDSTFIGTLLSLKRQVDGKEMGELALLAPTPECLEILRQMGLADVFPVRNVEELAEGVWSELPVQPGEGHEWMRHVVQAHQVLADLDGPVSKQFRAVMQALAEDPEASKRSDERGQS